MGRFLLILIVFFSNNPFLSQKDNTSKISDNTELVVFLSKKKNLDFLSKRGYYFLNIPKEKSFSDRLAGTILISDTSNLEINNIDVDFLMNDYQYYLVSNWNTLLVLKSVEHLINEMKSVE